MNLTFTQKKRTLFLTWLLIGILSFTVVGKYADYDALYEVLSAPEDSNKVVLPYGQKTLTFNAYVTSGQDNLIVKTDKESYWNGLTFQFIAMAPQRT